MSDSKNVPYDITTADEVLSILCCFISDLSRGAIHMATDTVIVTYVTVWCHMSRLLGLYDQSV